MLSLLEKLQSGLSFFLIFVLFLYVTFGIEWQPKATIGNVVPIEIPQAQASTVPASSSVPAVSSSRNLKVDRENRKILEKLTREQGLRLPSGTRPMRKSYRVEKRLYNYVAKETNWVKELNLAASTVHKTREGEQSMLTLHNIKEDSILKNFDFQDGDMIALIDGEIPNFDIGKTVEHYDMAGELFERLESGGKISVTVMRKGNPVHMEFQL